MVYICRSVVGFFIGFVFSLGFQGVFLQGAEGFLQGASVLCCILMKRWVL